MRDQGLQFVGKDDFLLALTRRVRVGERVLSAGILGILLLLWAIMGSAALRFVVCGIWFKFGGVWRTVDRAGVHYIKGIVGG